MPTELRRLRENLCRELAQSEHDAVLQTTREASRLHHCPPAEKLRAIADDSEQLGALVEGAREAAWADVRGNLDRRLHVEGMRPDQDPEYAVMREARMQALRLVDLQALSSEQRARRKRAQDG